MAIQYDPNLPIYPDSAKYVAPTVDTNSAGYVSPTLKDTTADLGIQKTADSYIDPSKATVGGQVNSLLADGSGLIQSAQADAMKTANNRGLLNSSMAATAGTKAAIDSVMPIAQQDAALYGNFEKTTQNTDSQGLINNQNAQIDQNKAANNATLTGSLNDQQFSNQQKNAANTAQLNAAGKEQDFSNTIASTGFQGGINKQLNEMTGNTQKELQDKSSATQITLNQMTGQTQKELQQMSGEISKTIASMNIDSAQKIALSNAMTSQTNTLMSNIGGLLNNTDIEMNDNVVNWMSDYMYKSLSGLSGVFNMDIQVA